jgi:hypothetical protein
MAGIFDGIDDMIDQSLRVTHVGDFRQAGIVQPRRTGSVVRSAPLGEVTTQMHFSSGNSADESRHRSLESTEVYDVATATKNSHSTKRVPTGMVGGSMQVLEKSGDRGRNRTYNLLIKSYDSRFSCSVTSCSHYNNLTNQRPAWTAPENVEKVGEIERRLSAKDTKRTQAIDRMSALGVVVRIAHDCIQYARTHRTPQLAGRCFRSRVNHPGTRAPSLAHTELEPKHQR